MRKRYAVMLGIAALVGGVVLFQAVTAKPPEPFVELVSPRPNAPVMRFECRNDQDWVIYTNGRNEVTEEPTGDPCYSRGWDSTGRPLPQPDRP